MAQRISAEQRKQIQKTYRDDPNYSRTAREHGVSAQAVKRIVEESGLPAPAPKRGAPPKFSNAAQMQEKVEAYFTSCEGEIVQVDDPDTGTKRPLLDKTGHPVVLGKRPPTVTGLALALGFSHRQALLNYQAKGEFYDTVMRAKSRVEQYNEERLFDREGLQGAKFSLINNFPGWSDKQDIGISGEIVQIIDDIPRDADAPDDSDD